MNKIDIILAVILGFGLVRGYMRGLVIEMASLLAIVVGIYGAIHFSFYTANLLSNIFSVEKQPLEVIAFVITLLVMMLLLMTLAKIITKMLKDAELGFLNRLAGALFGMLKAAVIIGSLFLFLERTLQTDKWLSGSLLTESVLYAPVKGISNMVYDKVFPK